MFNASLVIYKRRLLWGNLYMTSITGNITFTLVRGMQHWELRLQGPEVKFFNFTNYEARVYLKTNLYFKFHGSLRVI